MDKKPILPMSGSYGSGYFGVTAYGGFRLITERDIEKNINGVVRIYRVEEATIDGKVWLATGGAFDISGIVDIKNTNYSEISGLTNIDTGSTSYSDIYGIANIFNPNEKVVTTHIKGIVDIEAPNTTDINGMTSIAVERDTEISGGVSVAKTSYTELDGVANIEAINNTEIEGSVDIENVYTTDIKGIVKVRVWSPEKLPEVWEKADKEPEEWENTDKEPEEWAYNDPEKEPETWEYPIGGV